MHLIHTLSDCGNMRIKQIHVIINDAMIIDALLSHIFKVVCRLILKLACTFMSINLSCVEIELIIETEKNGGGPYQ